MRTNAYMTLEFHNILEQLSKLALSQAAKKKLLDLHPSLSERTCKQRMQETTEAQHILTAIGTPPLASMQGLTQVLELAQKGSMLLPEQLTGIADFLCACRRMKTYLKKAQDTEGGVACYGESFCELTALFEEIDRSVCGTGIDSNASPTLRDLRRKTEAAHGAIKAKLESILRSKKDWFADAYVATRNGRFVLPVKREYKNQINGTVVDSSGTGATCFMEPTAVRKLQEELASLQIEEENEVRKILYTLTALVDEQMNALLVNVDCMETLDFVFAKAKFSVECKAIPVPLTTDRSIKICRGRHPLLPAQECVPLDFEMGAEVRGIVITGPNTGGKTVALKTVGLLSLMAQSGLHVPVEQGSHFCMNSNILCDIGDGQSITENLSTFSAHITNIIHILQNLSGESLVLLDELGSGTDPAEGMGLAVAILEELRQSGCLFVATTHYPEIKSYAANAPNLINARMEFDRESLQPLFKLQIGEAGESCALYIARRLGFPEHMLKRAYAEAYGNTHLVEKAIPQMEFAQDLQRTLPPPLAGKIQKEQPQQEQAPASTAFQMGDSVMIYPHKTIAIVYRPANAKGEVTVQVKGVKQLINHKRIKLITPAKELYPADYDFSIVFDSVENRKARHQMDRKHSPDLTVTYEAEY